MKEKSCMHKRYKAFTLAEVLIALGIIGIIAAITIKALNNYTNDFELRVKFKKVYSELSAAFMKSVDDNGGPINCYFQDIEKCVIDDNIGKYLKITKKCGYSEAAAAGVCWHNSDKDLKWYFEPSQVTTGGFLQYNNNVYRFVINDEIFVQYGLWFSAFRIDINGFKGPNTFGRDIFDLGTNNVRTSVLGYSVILPTLKPSDYTIDYCGDYLPNNKIFVNRSGAACGTKILLNKDY